MQVHEMKSRVICNLCCMLLLPYPLMLWSELPKEEKDAQISRILAG